MENNLALIRWETTQNIDCVDLEDLKQFSIEDSAPRKQKSTDFYNPSSGKKIASTECHRPWYWRESIPAEMARLAKS
jgi:hypothetical protein